MSKQMLFLIHGVGYHLNGSWSDDITTKLKEVSSKYSWFKNNPLDTVVEIVPVNYDDIFRQIIDEWKTLADDEVKFIIENKILTNTSDIEKIKDFVDKSDDSKNFFWANIMDVLIYRSLNMKEYRDRIRMHVIDQLSAKIYQSLNSNEYTGCTVLAHSLGSHVFHDCMNLLGKTQWSKFGNAFAPDKWRFTNVFMIANTSYLLEDDFKSYSSLAKPGDGSDVNSYCYYYYNIKHALDPVCFRKPFQPTDWDPRLYIDIPPVNHFRKGFVHDFDHYLDNPTVHIPILRGISHPWSVTNEEEELAIKNYPQFVPEYPISQDELNALQVLKETMGQSSSNETLLPSIIQIFKAIWKFSKLEINTNL